MIWLQFTNTYGSPEMIRMSDIQGIRRTRNGVVEIKWAGNTSYADQNYREIQDKILGVRPDLRDEIPY